LIQYLKDFLQDQSMPCAYVYRDMLAANSENRISARLSLRLDP
jgi:hypothetical protein